VEGAQAIDEKPLGQHAAGGESDEAAQLCTGIEAAQNGETASR
jgi:hypothetical protein